MKILVVDDERDVQIMFEQKFRKELRAGEMELQFAFSGEEALDYLKDMNHEVILILSDINMPGMSGLELLRLIKLKKSIPPPSVVMITAYGDVDNYNMAMQLGAEGFLTKPLDFNHLKAELKLRIHDKDTGS